jgi:mono/diheme cytochrome c family protein
MKLPFCPLFIVFCFAIFLLPVKTFSQVQDHEWVVPKEANDLKNPLAGLQATKDAKQLYISNCIPCHGSGGKGDGPISNSLNPRPHDLTGKTVSEQTDGALYYRISNGHSSMPTFKNTLSSMERWQLVIYVRSLELTTKPNKSESKSKK